MASRIFKHNTQHACMAIGDPVNPSGSREVDLVPSIDYSSWVELHSKRLRHTVEQPAQTLVGPHSQDAPHQIQDHVASLDDEVVWPIASLVASLAPETPFAIGAPSLYTA